MMKTATISALLCVVSLSFVVVSRSEAALVAEMAFQTVNTVPNPDQTPIMFNKAGSSNLAQLINGTAADVAINTGSTGLGIEFIDQVRQGYLDIPSAASGGAQSINTLGPNGTLDKYINTSGGGRGQGSVMVVFKPDFNNKPAGRHTLFSHQIQTASQIWLMHNSTLGPFLRLGPDSAPNDLFMSSFNWDSSKWYAVGASWIDTSLGGNQYDRQMNLYVRELAENRPAAATNSLAANNITVSGITSSQFFVGYRSNSQTEGADGDIALFRMYDSYFTFADFDNAYESLFVIPEPGTGMMFALALPLWMLRRQRKAGQR